MESILKELYDNGLAILSGTDGGILQHELELYSKSGIPNAEVLKMATWYPAKVSGRDSLLGSIEEHKMASLVLIEGNPLRNMEDIHFGWGYYY
jgi:imidazolonepropionase-like amidohydrolase